MARARAHFQPALFQFLKKLAANNNRPWFQENKALYEDTVRHPAQQFVSDFGPYLHKISRHFNADPRPNGGSIFRIYRDTRFSKDKSPYKTYTGIQFRHTKARDAHCPGFYLHLQPGEVFVGVGIWHPDGSTLARIRQRINSDPGTWKRMRDGKKFRQNFEIGGDTLKRPPKGYAADHPMIEDLKRKDFIAVTRLSQKKVTSAGFLEEFNGLCRSGAPFVRWLCEAIGVEF